MGLYFLLAAVAVCLSGFFALAFFSLNDSTRRSLESVLTGRSQQYIKPLIKHQSELQMICVLLGALSNIAIFIFIVLALKVALEVKGILLGAVISAGLMSIFSVAIPYAWARYAGAKVLKITAAVLFLLYKLFLPIIVVMRSLDLPIRRLSGVPDPKDGNHNGSRGESSPIETALKAEILQVASEGNAEGAVKSEEMEMIESVIEFGERQAGEIMTPRTEIVALPVDADTETIRRTILEAGHSRIPVYDGDIDNIIGILYAKDLLAMGDKDNVNLRSIMRKPFFIPETKRLDDLLREFKARKMHMAIVLDEYGGTAGLVTVEDVIEEIVGDISDEYDRAESPLIKRIDEKTFEVDGRMYIDDFNDATGLHLPEEQEYETVAGFVFSELGVIPSVGESLIADGAKFTVLAADQRKIIRLRVELIDQPQKQDNE